MSTLDDAKAEIESFAPKKFATSWDADLIRLVQECRAMNQDLRFGQLLYNAVTGPEDNPEDFHTKLFYLTDEALVAKLKKYIEKG